MYFILCALRPALYILRFMVGCGLGRQLKGFGWCCHVIHALFLADTEGFRAVCGRFPRLDEACKGGYTQWAGPVGGRKPGGKRAETEAGQRPTGVALRAPPPPVRGGGVPFHRRAGGSGSPPPSIVKGLLNCELPEFHAPDEERVGFGGRIALPNMTTW